jgi:hypothetical protein
MVCVWSGLISSLPRRRRSMVAVCTGSRDLVGLLRDGLRYGAFR